MSHYQRLIVFLCALSFSIISACSSNPNALKITNIDGFQSQGDNDGGFKGLERLAGVDNSSELPRINIFYLHGIGWTEDPENDPLAGRFITGVANAYNLEVEGNMLQSGCGVSDNENMSGRVAHSIEITTGEIPIIYKTLLPGVELKLQKLVCMDRQTLKIEGEVEYVIYRVFWDENFWNQLQEAHVGQDDYQGYSKSLIKARKKYNRRLKDEMVNFGFSDAVMYLGPAGREIRLAVKGAMCAALLDASGIKLEQQDGEISAPKACLRAGNEDITTDPFAFISESLGSKISFDVMRDIMTDGRTDMLDEMIEGTELYMLANQLALLSLSDLSREDFTPSKIQIPDDRPRIVAISEVNDILTYEINPFFENLWNMQNWESHRPLAEFDFRAREKVSAFLGFDFVDIKVEFADPIVGLIGDFVDPLQAHSEHFAEPGIAQLILCGAENGNMREEPCRAYEYGNDDDD